MPPAHAAAAADQPSSGPRVRVRLFAALRDQAGWSERQLSGGATPLAIWRQLGLEAAGDLPVGVRVAINHRFAADNTPLQDGDELAFLPPISGG